MKEIKLCGPGNLGNVRNDDDLDKLRKKTIVKINLDR
jgi:hypothetical protein